MISEGEDYARINVVPTNFAPTFSLFQPVNDQHDAKGNCLERCDYDQIMQYDNEWYPWERLWNYWDTRWKIRGKKHVLFKQGATEKSKTGTFWREERGVSVKHLPTSSRSTLSYEHPRLSKVLCHEHRRGGLVLEGRNEVQVPLAAQNTCHDTCKRDRNATLCAERGSRVETWNPASFNPCTSTR